MAIHLRYEPIALNPLVTRAGDGATVVSRRDGRVDGRAAVRLETRAGGDALLTEGTRVVSWFVDTGPRTLVATTTSLARDGIFSAHVDILDRMVNSLDVTAAFACSAAGMIPDLGEHPELPTPVETMQTRLTAAAVACDLDALAKAATEGTRQFTFSFGGGDDPAAFWRETEQRGGDPMRELVTILSQPHARRATGSDVQYVWPEAYAREGDYLGYRTAMAEDGEWLFFVAGD